MEPLLLLQADPKFYGPLSRTPRRGVEYRPAGVPDTWSEHHDDVWTGWYPEHKLGGVTEGWKIHLSCRIDRAQHVLDTAAPIFVAHGTAFKHLSCSMFFVLTHHKHASRSQSGKFCTAYPPDEHTAGQLMAALADALDGEEGPYVLTDRRFGDSKVVHYRYGAYVSRSRVLADGGHQLLVRDGTGREVPDRRGVRFQLPDGIVDPFAAPADPARRSGPPCFSGFTFDSVVQYSNGGGAYQGRELATGRPVFIKESRGHNGLVNTDSTSQDRLRAEHDTLRTLHAAAPGICPEPIAFFRKLENEFLVTEFVPGQSLQSWWVEHNPVIWATATRADYAAYHERCLNVIDQLTGILDRLHTLGYVFVDLNPNNVLVGDDDTVRLVDFEAAARIGELTSAIGTPGYCPPPGDGIRPDHVYYDEYGLSSLALAMIAPVNGTADLHGGTLAQLRHQLGKVADVPPRLWTTATRFRDAAATPAPERVDADPLGELALLREKLVAGLLSPDHPDGVVPFGPQSYHTNPLSVGHGLAGVVHALRIAGVPAPELTERLAREAWRHRATLPPGLLVGLAGIAWVLADAGRVAEARSLLAVADDHPVLPGHATLGFGKAGVGLAHLALYGHTSDEFHLDRAADLAGSIPRDASLTGELGQHNATGLLYGRAGIALLDYYLARLTGGGLDDGRTLLAEELDRAVTEDGGLLFPVSEKDARLMPYLYVGSAGVGMVASRY
ncbi:MAG TPA: class III lanthionine synthetase LanKC, partial [Pseudonocardiaceae bacterium]|nr:class III lanthionine synthetase LanKC [Pseudonocardiaceae bacterium]